MTLRRSMGRQSRTRAMRPRISQTCFRDRSGEPSTLARNPNLLASRLWQPLDTIGLESPKHEPSTISLESLKHQPSTCDSQSRSSTIRRKELRARDIHPRLDRSAAHTPHQRTTACSSNHSVAYNHFQDLPKYSYGWMDGWMKE